MKFPTALAAAGLIARASAFCPGHRPFSPAASRARRSASALRAGGAEEEGFMRMQPAPTTSGYGLGYTPTTPLRPEAGNSFVPAADNVHDIWWTQRRARQRVRAHMPDGR